MEHRDPALETLLLLDGVSFVIDPDLKFWVKFVVTQGDASPERPHGLIYSFSLHDGGGQRLLGFDNAHRVRETRGPGSQARIEFDHKHTGDRIQFYSYTDGGTLIRDFWSEVDTVLLRRNRP
jgi:hypothetical protein